MRIKCPYCGERSLDEFVIQCDALPVRPDPSSSSAPEDFYVFAYERDNIAGRADEYWQHVAGCRAWLIVTRNTLTHEILAAVAARDLALEAEDALHPDSADPGDAA